MKLKNNETISVDNVKIDFFCVGVMYSGEYDACDVTLSVYPHRASLKNMPGHGAWPQTYFSSLPGVDTHSE
jgi:hypothetical protein